MQTLNLGVLASGRGSNFGAILNAIDRGDLDAEVRLLVSNNPNAGALEKAAERGIAQAVIRRSEFDSSEGFADELIKKMEQAGIDLIVLAGYMKKIPDKMIAHFRYLMINIHPALLPAFGGKGMYGHHVHEAVIRSGCQVSGVTIHFVDEVYDHGPIIAQQSVPVFQKDTPDTLAARVLQVEHRLFPETLQLFAEKRVRITDGRVIVDGRE